MSELKFIKGRLRYDNGKHFLFDLKKIKQAILLKQYLKNIPKCNNFKECEKYKFIKSKNSEIKGQIICAYCGSVLKTIYEKKELILNPFIMEK